MARVTLPNSTYLDLTGYHTTTATTVAEAYGLHGAPVPSDMTLNVALILPRANDAAEQLGDPPGQVWARGQILARAIPILLGYSKCVRSSRGAR